MEAEAAALAEARITLRASAVGGVDVDEGVLARLAALEAAAETHEEALARRVAAVEGLAYESAEGARTLAAIFM